MGSQASALARPRFAGRRQTLLARNPALARMIGASFVSSAGDRLHQLALAALILALTDSMASAGLVFVVSMLPYVLFGLVTGTLVDRWDRRRTLVGADLVRGVLVVIIPLAAFVSLPMVYVLLFVLSCATMTFAAARQAAVPDLVAAEDLTAANSLFQTANYLADVLGFPLAAAFVAALTQAVGPFQGAQAAFAVDAGSYLLSALLLLGLPLRGQIGSRAEPLRTIPTRIREGLAFLRDHAQVRTNTVLLTLGPLLLGSMHTLWIGFAWRVSNTGAVGYGVTETANAAGTLLGLWLLQVLMRRLNKGRVIVLGFLVMGLAILCAGLTDSLAVVAALAAVGGMGNILFIVPSITLVQQQTPSELRGRVFGARFMLTYGAFAASNALAGSLSDLVGVSRLLVALGGGMALMALIAAGVRSAREAD
jgi:MFS family permease